MKIAFRLLPYLYLLLAALVLLSMIAVLLSMKTVIEEPAQQLSQSRQLVALSCAALHWWRIVDCLYPQRDLSLEENKQKSVDRSVAYFMPWLPSRHDHRRSEPARPYPSTKSRQNMPSAELRGSVPRQRGQATRFGKDAALAI